MGGWIVSVSCFVSYLAKRYPLLNIDLLEKYKNMSKYEKNSYLNC
jgi:L-2-hydroxyglutarate oxidase LhgO